MINEIFSIKVVGESLGGCVFLVQFLWWRVMEQFAFLARTCLYVFRHKGEALQERGICHVQGQLLSVGLSQIFGI